MLLKRVALSGLVVGQAYGADNTYHQVKRDLDSISNEYDYIIVGGGTSGLVVANRLSEDPKKKILVVEYGDFALTKNTTVPYFTTLDQTPRLYGMKSVPQVHLDNRVSDLRIGKAVGGGSSVNGMAFDRGSSVDYDGWEQLGNSGWGWDVLYKYFRKSAHFQPPAKEYIKRYGYEWDPEAYGDGPVQVGYPSWQWPEAVPMVEAWTNELKARVLVDGANGTNVGLAWLPQNSGGKDGTRSTSETAYYQPAKRRSNLNLLIKHYGAAIQFKGNKATGVKLTSRDNSKKSKVVNAKHVIMAAGAVNTPRILQISGVGPAKLLKSLGIKVVVDAPGVGANFQDHPSFLIIYKFDNDTKINPDLMNDADFYNKAWKEYETKKTGPFTHAWGNHVAFTSLQGMDPDFKSVASALGNQDPLSHLPALYAEYPALVKGFLRQRAVMEAQLLDPEAAVAEFAFGGSSAMQVALQKPLSRGTILINSTNPDPSVVPLIDFNSASNTVDMLMAISAFRKAREMMGTASLASLKPVELIPGPEVETDAQIEKAMRESVLSPSFDHPIGTAAMMPREDGGVVDSKLRVYGVEGLWVVDASIMPLLPAAHTQATVYAIAEHAADLIKKYGS